MKIIVVFRIGDFSDKERKTALFFHSNVKISFF